MLSAAGVCADEAHKGDGAMRARSAALRCSRDVPELFSYTEQRP